MDETITLYTPALVIMKAERLVRTNKADNLLDAIDVVLDDEYSFPVFCAFLNIYLRELEESEFLRDEQRNPIQSYVAGTRKAEKQSNELILRHNFNLVCQGICKWFRNEACMENLVVKMTEDRASYLIGRYAIQRVARELSDKFEFDQTTPRLLEEARKHKLPAITGLLKACIDLPYLFTHKPEESVTGPPSDDLING